VLIDKIVPHMFRITAKPSESDPAWLVNVKVERALHRLGGFHGRRPGPEVGGKANGHGKGAPRARRHRSEGLLAVALGHKHREVGERPGGRIVVGAACGLVPVSVDPQPLARRNRDGIPQSQPWPGTSSAGVGDGGQPGRHDTRAAAAGHTDTIAQRCLAS
jgi:hypothetical protein